MIIWVMNACYSFHRQLTLMYLRIKVKTALWNGCEDHVAFNYMIGLTAVKYCEIDMIFFKPVMILFFLENDQIISNPFLFIVSEFVYSICAYGIVPFWKGLEKDLKTLKSSSLHRNVCSNIFLTLVFEKGPLMKENSLCIHFILLKDPFEIQTFKSRTACATAESLCLL